MPNISKGMKSIVILASGSGSNAQKIIERFSEDSELNVSALISDRKESKALSMARSHGVEAIHLLNSEIQNGALSVELDRLSPDLIVLAGFLRKIPKNVTQSYPDRIINIHPSLLPAHGGKGMYGMHVHRAVLAAGDRQTGMSIHYVNERYDEGRVIAQLYCDVYENDSAEDVQSRVLSLEHYYYPIVIEKLLKS